MEDTAAVEAIGRTMVDIMLEMGHAFARLVTAVDDDLEGENT